MTDKVFGYDSYKEALAYMSRPTTYELNKRIGIASTREVIDTDDFKVVLRETTDRKTGLILFFRVSRQLDKWIFIYPSSNQVEHLQFTLPYLLHKVLLKNKNSKVC